MITIANQGPVDPLVPRTIIQYKGHKNPLPQASTTGSIPIDGGMRPLIGPKYLMRPFPFMNPSATIPITAGTHLSPIKPLPGGGGGSSGITIGYGI